MQLYFATPNNKDNSIATLVKELPVSLQYNKPQGVFVTLSKNGKPRACWGSVFPEYPNVVEATVYATLGALSKDYRYKPITRFEWMSLKPQVTVVRGLDPLGTIRNQNPLKDGLFVRSGNKTAVLLPGEATDSTYQLVQCKLKAGIKPGESCQLYRIRADVYE